jgi:hypothetical protein
LLNLVKATESERNANGKDSIVAPWYYNELAVIYRKRKDVEAEVAILERYVRHSSRPKDELVARLEKARALKKA